MELKITATQFNKLPKRLQELFIKLPNQSREEVRECFPDTGKGNGKGVYNYAGREYDNQGTSMFNGDKPQAPSNFNDSGSASRFFKSIIYQTKASKSERNKGCEELEEKNTPNNLCSGSVQQSGEGTILDGKPLSKNNNNHPTVKPIVLMEYLIKMITKEWGIVLDPFAGSGTTWIACKNTNRNFIMIEKDEWYFNIANKRLKTTTTSLF